MPADLNPPPLGPYLETLNEEQLQRMLTEVLNEVRKRDADKIKKDILTHSQSLRLKNPIR